MGRGRYVGASALRNGLVPVEVAGMQVGFPLHRSEQCGEGWQSGVELPYRKTPYRT